MERLTTAMPDEQSRREASPTTSRGQGRACRISELTLVQGGLTMIQPLSDLDFCFGDGITMRSSFKVGAF